MTEPQPDRIAFPFTRLSENLRSRSRPPRQFFLNHIPGIVRRIALDEDELGARSHLRYALENVRDVARFVAGGYDHRDASLSLPLPGKRPGDHKISQAENVKRSSFARVLLIESAIG